MHAITLHPSAGETVDIGRLRRSEAILLQRMNAIITPFKRPELHRLGELFGHAKTLLATYPELDYYGERDGGCYIGSLFSSGGGQSVRRQSSDKPRIFAYLRPSMPGFDVLLRVLSAFPAETIVVAPGVRSNTSGQENTPSFRLYTRPISLERDWLQQADLAISYGGAGTVSQCL
ncbi:hypothetical protein [Methylomonas sp. HYX-M1]|uniref:hypothetical protein n=1 Tax=Methylomonas sp. HYX-M1 TaxID=3139307 RepID=UPI00345BC4F5